MTEDYESWTVDRYNATIAAVVGYKRHFAYAVLVVVLLTTAVTLVMTRWTAVADVYGRATYSPVEWVVVLWLLPLPIMVWRGWVYLRGFNPPRLGWDPKAGRGHRVVFQVTTTGMEANTVGHTADSVRYWRNALNPAFACETWVVTEPSGYAAHRAVYEGLARRGVNIVVVPPSYACPGGSVRKARALQYAVDLRREWGYDPKTTWVYHQDDETAVGEDTFAGIAAFLDEHGGEPCVGTGIILYPQAMGDWRPSAVADLNRTKDDIGNLYSLTRTNRASQFHGSHYLVRVDVESAVGFDLGKELSVIDDLSFEVGVRRRFGNVVRYMGGFAYEQSPLTWRDQIRQRRRWVVGLKAAERRLDMPLVRRASLAYYVTAWAAGAASTFTIALPVVFNFEAVLPFGMTVSALSWSLMVWGYVVGYRFHREYVNPARPVWRVVGNGIVGAGVDAVAVWVGLLARNSGGFQLVRKDAPEEERRR